MACGSAIRRRFRSRASTRSFIVSSAAIALSLTRVGAMLTHEKMTLTRNFFATLASQMSRLYHYANKEVESWLRAIMAPMETQIRERQIQVRRRLESIKRIHHATESLEDRVVELEHAEAALLHQLDGLHHLAREIDRVLDLETASGAGRGARYAA